MAQQNGLNKDAADDSQYASVDRLAQLTANPTIPRRKKQTKVDYTALADAMKHDDDDLFLMADALQDQVPLAEPKHPVVSEDEQPKAAGQADSAPSNAPAADKPAEPVVAKTASAPASSVVAADKAAVVEQKAPAASTQAESSNKATADDPQDDTASEQSWPVDIKRPAPVHLVDDQPATKQHSMHRSGLAPRFTPIPNFQQVDQAYTAYRKNK